MAPVLSYLGRFVPAGAHGQAAVTDGKTTLFRDTHPGPTSETLSINPSNITSSGSVCENELHTRGNTVIWSRGGQLVSRYTMQGPVLDAVFTAFVFSTHTRSVNDAKSASSNNSHGGEPTRLSRPGTPVSPAIAQTSLPTASSTNATHGSQGVVTQCLCILEVERISVYTNSGDEYLVTLPFKASSLRVMPHGLLVTRRVDNGSFLSTQSIPETAPVLFAIMHPLREIAPVSYLNIADKDEEVKLTRERAAHITSNDSSSKGSRGTDPYTEFMRTYEPSDVFSPAYRRDSLAFGPANKTRKRRLHYGVDSPPQSPSNDISDLSLHDEKFVADHGMVILHTCPDLPLLVTYNETSHTHSIFLLRLRSRASATLASAHTIPVVQNPMRDCRSPLFNDSFLKRTGGTGGGGGGGGLNMSGLTDHSPGAGFAGLEGPMDDIDLGEQLSSDIYVQKLWSQTHSCPMAEKVFYFTDPAGRAVLCMLTAETQSLQTYTIAQGFLIQPGFTIEHVQSACGIDTSRTSTLADPQQVRVDLMCLMQDGSLSLYDGEQSYWSAPPAAIARLLSPSLNDTRPTADVRMSQTGAEDSSDASMGIHDTVPVAIALDSAVGSLVNITFSDQRVGRFQVDLGPSSPLVASAMSALAAVLSRDHFRMFHSAFLAKAETGYPIRTAQRAGAGMTTTEAIDYEWNLFASLVLAGTQRPGAPADPVPSTPGTARGESSLGGSAWDALCASDFHNDFRSRNHIATLASSAFSTTLLPTVTRGVDRAVGVLSPFPYQVAFQVHQALHLVYENCKLSVLLRPRLKKLVGLLWDIACDLALSSHLDYYTRDFGDLVALGALQARPSHIPSNEQTAATSAANRPVADIFAHLEALLHTPVPNTMVGDGGGSAPPISTFDFPDSLKATCRLISQMSLFYSTLRPTDDSLERGVIRSPLNKVTNHAGVMSTPSFYVKPSDPYATPRAGTAQQSAAFRILFPPSDLTTPAQRYIVHEPSARLVLEMVNAGFTKSDLDSLTFGVALPLREALRECRPNAPTDWPSAAYELLGREDLVSQLRLDHDTQVAALRKKREKLARGSQVGQGISVGISQGGGTRGLAAGPSAADMREEELTATASAAVAGSSTVPNTSAATSAADSIDGCEGIETLCPLRFGKDRRLYEVRRLVQSSKPVRLKMDVTGELSDHDLVAAQQTTLGVLARRTLSLAIGRGMVTLGSIRQLSTDTVVIPNVSLAGRVAPKQPIVNLDCSNIQDGFANWPEFHNGVAAGLRISPGDESITRTWIKYNKPGVPTYGHAGLLMGLGLQGHLSSLSLTDTYDYLSRRHEATNVGLLLGLAAGRKGTMDPELTKILSLHLPSLMPVSISELEVSPLVQTAALTGFGLLYMGTGHRRTSELLLNEIGQHGRRPDSDFEREGYSLAAGMALGFVVLGRGQHTLGLADLRVEDRLRMYMTGGTRDHSTRGPGSALETTAPGATLALGLMYIRTGDQAVAARLEIPDSHFLIDYVQPSLVLLRLISRNLVLWSDIKPTKEWVTSQVPQIVSDCVLHPEKEAGLWGGANDIDVDALHQTFANILAGSCFMLGLKYAGTSRQDVFDLLKEYLDVFEKMEHTAAVEYSIRYVLLAFSLLVAGTGNVKVLALIRKYRANTSPVLTYGHHMCLHMALGFLFLGGGMMSLSLSNEAIACLVCSLYPIFPNATTDQQYHLQALRHLYVLAAEPRVLEAFDVDTGASCYVPLEITLKPGAPIGVSKLELTAPCLLPEFRYIRSLRVKSPRYWDVAISVEHSMIQEHRSLYVKRKSGYLSYAEDLTGTLGIMSRPLQNLDNDDITQDDFIKAFSADPKFLAFVHNFCRRGDADPHSAFSSSVLYECLSREKPNLISTFLALYSVISDLSVPFTGNSIRNVKLVLSYYASAQSRLDRDDKHDDGDTSISSLPLIQASFLEACRVKLMTVFDQCGFATSRLFQVYLDRGIPALASAESGELFHIPSMDLTPAQVASLFGAWLIFLSVSPLAQLRQQHASLASLGVPEQEMVLASQFQVPVSSIRALIVSD